LICLQDGKDANFQGGRLAGRGGDLASGLPAKSIKAFNSIKVLIVGR
jgi:hypothetical protein